MVRSKRGMISRFTACCRFTDVTCSIELHVAVGDNTFGAPLAHSQTTHCQHKQPVLDRTRQQRARVQPALAATDRRAAFVSAHVDDPDIPASGDGGVAGHSARAAAHLHLLEQPLEQAVPRGLLLEIPRHRLSYVVT